MIPYINPQGKYFIFNLFLIQYGKLYTRSVRELSALPLYLRAGVILHHRAGGILQSNPHLIE